MKNEDNLAKTGICTLCPKCSMNSIPHYLNKKLIISYCDCENMGGLYLGFYKNPHWKLFAQIDKSEFYTFAKSVNAYIECMRESPDNQTVNA